MELLENYLVADLYLSLILRVALTLRRHRL